MHMFMHISKLIYSFPSQILCSRWFDDHYSCTSSEGFSRRRNLDYRVVVPPIHPDRIPFSGSLLDSKDRKLQIWMDHLIFHHYRTLPSSSHPSATNHSKAQPSILIASSSLPILPGTRLFFGGGVPKVFKSSGRAILKSRSSPPSSPNRNCQIKTQRKYFSSSLQVWWFPSPLATNNNFYRFLHCRFSSLCHLHWDGP